MEDKDMSNIINALNGMLKNNNMPNNMKDLLNNMKNNNENKDSNNNQNSTSSNSSINPDMINNFINMIANNSSNGSNNNSHEKPENNSPQIDLEMMMKMKRIIDKMNSNKDDTRANLLKSLKPYLNDSRKEKVDQYIQLFNMSKIIEVFNSSGGDKEK